MMNDYAPNMVPESQTQPVMGVIDPTRAGDPPVAQSVESGDDNRALFDDLASFAGLFSLFISIFRGR